MPGKRASIEERLWRRVMKIEGGCWIFTGGLTGAGYGQVGRRKGQSSLLAHRLAYELIVGPIPADLQVDHLCRDRTCCNPAHMELVTRRENIMRGVGVGALNAAKTVCPSGHALAGSNLYVGPDGRRSCRICKREQSRRAYRKRVGRPVRAYRRK